MNSVYLLRLIILQRMFDFSYITVCTVLFVNLATEIYKISPRLPLPSFPSFTIRSCTISCTSKLLSSLCQLGRYTFFFPNWFRRNLDLRGLLSIFILFIFLFSMIVFMIQSMTLRNKRPDITQPCFTSDITPNYSM